MKIWNNNGKMSNYGQKISFIKTGIICSNEVRMLLILKFVECPGNST